MSATAYAKRLLHAQFKYVLVCAEPIDRWLTAVWFALHLPRTYADVTPNPLYPVTQVGDWIHDLILISDAAFKNWDPVRSGFSNDAIVTTMSGGSVWASASNASSLAIPSRTAVTNACISP